MANILKPTFLIVITFLSCSTKQSNQAAHIGAVATAHPLATQAGQEVLAAGGNAFDASIAIAATLNVVEPMMSGIGGYGTILIYDAEENRVRFLNSSGRFPINSNADLMRAPTPDFMDNRFGPKAISTPGNLNAWKTMHEVYGKLKWDQLFESAITYAENGFRVSPFLENMIGRSFSEFSSYARTIYGKEGKPLSEGDLLIQEDLANTFKSIKVSGVESFYRGEMAIIIDEQMKRSGSFLSLRDLESNEAEWWEPLQINYKGFDVYTASLPANAFPAFVNLGLMQEVTEQNLEHNSAEYLHLFAEMTKESYASRLKYSFDPDIQESPIDSILSKSVLAEMAYGINRERASTFEPPFSAASKNTTHYVVIDKWGNIVSSTQTLGGLFGSKVMVEGLGIWMNGSIGILEISQGRVGKRAPVYWIQLWEY